MWGAMMVDKPWQFWAALVATVVFAAIQASETGSFLMRSLKAGGSGLLAASLAGDFAHLTFGSENLALVLIGAFGFAVLEVFTAIIADQTFIKEIIRSKIGGRKDGDG